MLRWFFLALTLLVPAACTDRDAPRPVSELATPPPKPTPLRPLSTRDGGAPRGVVTPAATPAARAANALPPGVPDPTESGISDLARLARYVFREMRLHETDCPLVNPFHDRLSFTLETEVRGGRIVRVGIGSAALERSGQKAPVPESQWPPELETFATCIEPHLEAVQMSPSPADGVYQPEYSYPGHGGS